MTEVGFRLEKEQSIHFAQTEGAGRVVVVLGEGGDTRKFFHDCFYSPNELGSRIARQGVGSRG